MKRKKRDLESYFKFDGVTRRIRSAGSNATLSIDSENPCDSPVYICTVLQDSNTGRKTDRRLILSLDIDDAVNLAREILTHAEICGLADPDKMEDVSFEYVPSSKLH